MEVQQNVSRSSYSDWLYFFLNLNVQTCTTFLEIRVLFLYPRNKVFFIFFQGLFYAEFADLSLHKSGILNSFGVHHCWEEVECLTLLSWFCICTVSLTFCVLRPCVGWHEFFFYHTTRPAAGEISYFPCLSHAFSFFMVTRP